MDLSNDFFNEFFGFVGAGVGVTVIVGIIMFVLVFSIIITVIVKSVNQDKKSPQLTVPATVVSKRAHMPRSHHRATGVNDYGMSSSTFYYVTFQFEGGDRVELCVPVYEVGLMIEGDRGILCFKGSRFISFKRT